MSIYTPGTGYINAKILVLHESPSISLGKEFDYILRECEINKSELWITTVSKYPVEPNHPGKKIPFTVRAKNSGVDAQQQVMELQTEINSVKPNVILSLGSTALWAVTGKTKIAKFRGSILHGMGIKVIPTYHTSDLTYGTSVGEMKGYYNRQVIMFDIRRAKYQSTFPEMKLPQRILQICKNSYDLVQFLNQYKSHSRPSIDIEAGGHCLPICVGISFTPKHGMCVPLWNCDGISSIPDADLVQIWIILAEFLAQAEVVGQNFNYDRDKLLRLGFVIKRLLSDTMYKAFAINPELPKGLAFNTSIYTEEPYYKDEGMYEGSITDLFTGCARDACVTKEIDIVMENDLIEIGQYEYYYNYLMKLPDMYWAIENQGFGIDPVARDELLYKYVEWDEQIRYRLFQLVGDEVNVNSPPQMDSLLFDNFKLPRKYSTGEEAITELLNSPKVTDEVHREVLELILQGRRVKKSISNYLMAMPDFDGRMRTTYFPCLETGRSSTGQQEPPIRPEVEIVDEHGKKKKKKLGIAFQTMTKHGDIGADIRRMYIP